MFPSRQPASAASAQRRRHEPDDSDDDRSLPDVDLLHHDADLLRQRRPAPRPRLHDDRRRHARALSPHARRRHAVPHRHRRARPEGRGGREQARADAAAARRSGRAALRRDVEDARHRRTTASSARPSEKHKQVVASLWKRIREHNPDDLYLASYQGWYCVGCEAFYTESQLRQGRRQLVLHDPQDAGRAGSTRSAAGSSGSRSTPSRCSRTSRRTPTSSGPSSTATRSSSFLEGRPARSVGVAHELLVGHPGARGRSRGPLARHLRVDGRADELPLATSARADGSDRRPGRRRSTGRTRCTSSARTSCAFTRCTGRRS